MRMYFVHATFSKKTTTAATGLSSLFAFSTLSCTTDMSFSRLLYSCQPVRRLFNSTKLARISSLSRGPAPPRLPQAEQELYERLQRSSTGAFSTPNPSRPLEQESGSSDHPPSRANLQRDPPPQEEVEPVLNDQPELNGHIAEVQATGEGEELHPDVRRGSQPEFEGEINPQTGEVGGPKNEPLRWGGKGDWSYNGRVTDF